MKKFTLTILVSLIALTGFAQGINFEAEGTTLEQASTKAKAEKKLIFLDCFTQWCGPCKNMAKKIFPTEKVGNYMNPKFICLKIDMESTYGAPLAKKLQIEAYPTFVIFNENGEEIGRFLGGCDADNFISQVEAKSKDNSGSALAERWNKGDRDPQFLMEYLKSLSASYKGDDADLVAEAILEGKESTFASDSTLRAIFLRNINNPFAKSFVYTIKNPDALVAAIGDVPVNMKIDNVLKNYNRKLINEDNGKVTFDEENFAKFKALLADCKVKNADHYTLSTLITLAEKQKDMDSYLKYIKEYLANPNLDADDMQLARWTKPFSDALVTKEQKEEMKGILSQRLSEIQSGKRQAQTKVGNMTLSRPMSDVLGMLIDVLDGKMPTK